MKENKPTVICSISERAFRREAEDRPNKNLISGLNLIDLESGAFINEWCLENLSNRSNSGISENFVSMIVIYF